MWIFTASLTDGVIKDTCKGDSGGPLVIDNGGQPLLIGILNVSKILLVSIKPAVEFIQLKTLNQKIMYRYR